MNLTKLLLTASIAVGCCFQSAAAQQVDVYALGNLGENGVLLSEIQRFDESGPQLDGQRIPETRFGLSLATDNSSLFAAEFDGAINRYDLQGNFLGEFADVSTLSGGRPNLQFVESDGQGNIYTAFGGQSSEPRTSFRLDSTGSISASFSHPQLVFPRGIDADADGNVFILNSAAVGIGNRLFQFDAAGNYVDDFALSGVLSPSDIAIDETTNELLVADEFGEAVHIFDLVTGTPALTDSLSVPDAAIDVFVEPASGRIFGSLLIFDQDDQGSLLRTEGFELSRDGTIAANYVENVAPRDQSVRGVVAIATAVPEPSAATPLALFAILFFVRRNRKANWFWYD